MNKQMQLIGHRAGSLFTPCTTPGSLVQAITETARSATSGDVVLLSPACSSSDQFQKDKHRRDGFCLAVKSIGGGVHGGTPNMHCKQRPNNRAARPDHKESAAGLFEGKSGSETN
jgi:hypothetical protein